MAAERTVLTENGYPTAMIYSPDHTHDSKARSWVEASNEDDCSFPIQNLPWCVFRSERDARPTIGVGIGDDVLDARSLAENGLLSRLSKRAIARDLETLLGDDMLNGIMALSVQQRRELRYALFELLHVNCPLLRDDAALRAHCLLPMRQVEYCLPARIGDYSDFYASIFHATNVGSMMRPDNPLLPNYRWIPIGYHGRASSIVVSGTEIRRPTGQTSPLSDGNPPSVQPSSMLDYELEVAIWIAEGNRHGETIPMADAERHWFGIGLLNDWSARDMQRWEYQPLGPFLAKSFASTISPWIVTSEALAPFRCPAPTRAGTEPQPLAYLDSPENREVGGVDLTLEVHLQSRTMRQSGTAPILLSRGSFRDLYWTIAQMITHHASNGCNLQPGDLLGSGTVSGPDRSSRGCLLELTWDGEFGNPVPGTQRTALELPSDERRVFLADGDEVTLIGYCDAPGYRKIGLGECRGTVRPA